MRNVSEDGFTRCVVRYNSGHSNDGTSTRRQRRTDCSTVLASWRPYPPHLAMVPWAHARLLSSEW